MTRASLAQQHGSSNMTQFIKPYESKVKEPNTTTNSSLNAPPVFGSKAIELTAAKNDLYTDLGRDYMR